MMYKNSFIITGGKIICPLLFLAITSLSFGSYKAADNNISDLTFEKCIDSAEYYSSIKRWNDAERMTVNALRLKPANKTNWLLWSNLAEIRQQLNDPTGALTAYNIGLSLQPSSIKMLSGRASILIEEKKLDEAFEDLNSILLIDSILEWPRMMRGLIALEKGDYYRATQDFETLKRRYPDNPQSYNGLAAISAKEGRTEEAIDLYKKSLSIMPDENVYFYLVALQADNDKLPDAAESLREAMKKFPRNGNLFLLRAYLHKLNFQNQEAEIALKLAREYGADSHLIENIFPKNSSSKRLK